MRVLVNHLGKVITYNNVSLIKYYDTDKKSDDKSVMIVNVEGLWERYLSFKAHEIADITIDFPEYDNDTDFVQPRTV